MHKGEEVVRLLVVLLQPLLQLLHLFLLLHQLLQVLLLVGWLVWWVWLVSLLVAALLLQDLPLLEQLGVGGLDVVMGVALLLRWWMVVRVVVEHAGAVPCRGARCGAGCCPAGCRCVVFFGPAGCCLALNRAALNGCRLLLQHRQLRDCLHRVTAIRFRTSAMQEAYQYIV